MPAFEKKSKVGIDLNKHLQEWGNAILRAAIIIIILFFFCWPMRLMGSSMEPTMGDGEIVLMNRFAAMQGHYEKGDIVMFHYFDAEGDKTVVTYYCNRRRQHPHSGGRCRSEWRDRGRTIY